MQTLTHSKTKAVITVADSQARAILAGQKRSDEKRGKVGAAAQEAFTKFGGKWSKKGSDA